MKIGVVGYGVVGRHMGQDITNSGNELVIYDVKGIGSQEKINECAAAFVCVSTPPAADGSCDLTAIDDVFSWLRVPVAIIRSTVPPGTTGGLLGCPAVFCPEFIGEGVNAPYSAMKQPPFVIIGGPPLFGECAAEIFAQLYNAECEFIYTDSTTAELAKYAENYFLALKVLWANELYDIAACVGADFGQMMAAVTHDYRIGRSHTHVYPDKRGFDGRCLPKDTSALLALVGEDTAPLLAAMRKVNEKWKSKQQP